MSLEEGIKAPDFTLADENGTPTALSQFQGQKVVLYFYPKDDTPGCTTEACGIRDQFPRFEGTGSVVLGVSPDGPESHRKFKDKYQLPFTLLADTGHEVAETYGVWAKKQMYGKEYMGVDRTTFLIDEQGDIEKIFRRVSPAEHPEELLAALGQSA